LLRLTTIFIRPGGQKPTRPRFPASDRGCVLASRRRATLLSLPCACAAGDQGAAGPSARVTGKCTRRLQSALHDGRPPPRSATTARSCYDGPPYTRRRWRRRCGAVAEEHGDSRLGPDHHHHRDPVTRRSSRGLGPATPAGDRRQKTPSAAGRTDRAPQASTRSSRTTAGDFLPPGRRSFVGRGAWPLHWSGFRVPAFRFHLSRENIWGRGTCGTCRRPYRPRQGRNRVRAEGTADLRFGRKSVIEPLSGHDGAGKVGSAVVTRPGRVDGCGRWVRWAGLASFGHLRPLTAGPVSAGGFLYGRTRNRVAEILVYVRRRAAGRGCWRRPQETGTRRRIRPPRNPECCRPVQIGPRRFQFRGRGRDGPLRG